MSLELFLILLGIIATATGFVTEGVKKLLDGKNVKYASNIVVLIVSVIVGGGGTVVFYILNNIAFNTVNVICILLMIVANWLGAMLGYDKIMQAITQMKSK